MRAKQAFICEICVICEKSFFFEALCFNEDAEFNFPVFAPFLQSFKIWLY